MQRSPTVKASTKRRGMKDKAKEAKGSVAAKGEEGAKPTMVLKVKEGVKYRGAREAWYNLLRECNGKSPEDFIKLATDKPPSLTKKNEAEPPQGWLRFFQRTGVVSLGA